MMLNYFEFPNVSLHSQKPQRERLAALVKFRSNQVRLQLRGTTLNLYRIVGSCFNKGFTQNVR